MTHPYDPKDFNLPERATVPPPPPPVSGGMSDRAIRSEALARAVELAATRRGADSTDVIELAQIFEQYIREGK